MLIIFRLNYVLKSPFHLYDQLYAWKIGAPIYLVRFCSRLKCVLKTLGQTEKLRTDKSQERTYKNAWPMVVFKWLQFDLKVNREVNFYKHYSLRVVFFSLVLCVLYSVGTRYVVWSPMCANKVDTFEGSQTDKESNLAFLLRRV